MNNIIGKKMKIDKFHKEYIIEINYVNRICKGVYTVSGLTECSKKFTLTCLQDEIIKNIL